MIVAWSTSPVPTHLLPCPLEENRFRKRLQIRIGKLQTNHSTQLAQVKGSPIVWLHSRDYMITWTEIQNQFRTCQALFPISLGLQRRLTALLKACPVSNQLILVINNQAWTNGIHSLLLCKVPNWANLTWRKDYLSWNKIVLLKHLKYHLNLQLKLWRTTFYQCLKVIKRDNWKINTTNFHWWVKVER